MLSENLDDLFHGIAEEISNYECFTNEFKSFAVETVIICKLCNVYENGTGNKITKKNVNDEKGVFNFIIELKPVLKNIGIELNISNKVIKKLIKDFYLVIDQNEFSSKDKV